MTDVAKRLKLEETRKNTLSDAITFNQIIELKLKMSLGIDETKRQLSRCKDEIDTLIDVMTDLQEENDMLKEALI